MKIKSLVSVAAMRSFFMGGLYVALSVGMPASAQEVNTTSVAPKTMPQDFDQRHEVCLEQIAVDADLAYEEAMIWKSEGGGRRARHCVAMALFALGHEDEAAFRISKMARDEKIGPVKMRMDYYAQGVDLWLKANLAHEALTLAAEGLELMPSDVDLRLERARAYVALGRWDYAEIDLTSALSFKPNHAQALRYRADARLRQDKLGLAKADIDRAMRLDGENIDVLLIRGKIIEAQRLAK